MGTDPRNQGKAGAPVLDHQIHAYVRERARAKLGKYGKAIQSIKVGLREATAGGGDPWVACRITIGLGHGGPVVIERSAAAAWEAVDHTLGAAARAVRRILQRLRHRDG